MKPAPETSSPTLLSLRSHLAARRTPQTQQRLRVVEWRERLTSLWAPVLTFALLFAPYVLLVELSYQSHVWAQPLLKVIGLGMVIWFVALAIHRLASPSARRLRRLRVEAGELLLQLDRELRRNKEAPASAREKVLQQAVALDDARLERDADAIEGAATRLNQVSDKLLPGWRKRSTWDGVKGLIWTLVAVLLLRTLFVEPYKIPTGSMLPTLNLGDHVVVNRFLYGVRIPFLNVVPFVIVRPPARGDVIVFNNPVNTREDFIKRVVGVPGDTIELIDEVVHVNGVPQPRRLVDPDFTVWNRDNGQGPWELERRPLYEELLDGHPHAVLRNPALPHDPRQGPYVVPEGHVFVLGDNRDSSSDSRYGFGTYRGVEFVPYGNIKGKAMVIWLSLSHDGLFSWIYDDVGLRTDRLFTPIR